MNHFHYQGGRALAPRTFRSRRSPPRSARPATSTASATLRRHYRVFDEAFAAAPHLVCYSVKANSNLAVLARLRRAGQRLRHRLGRRALPRAARRRRPAADRLLGRRQDARRDGLRARAQASSPSTSSRRRSSTCSTRVAARGRPQGAGRACASTPTSIRRPTPTSRPGMKKRKFGIDIRRAARATTSARAIARAPRGRRRRLPHRLAADRRLAVRRRARARPRPRSSSSAPAGFEHPLPRLRRRPRHHLQRRGRRRRPKDYAATLLGDGIEKLGVTLLLEPGRVLVGNAGVLLTRVLYLKDTDAKNFVIVDGAMNDLIRPSLYGAYHEIEPVQRSGATIGRRRRRRAGLRERRLLRQGPRAPGACRRATCSP